MNHRPAPLDLLVIIGSTREGRRGPSIAGWFAAEAEHDPRFDVTLVDLIDIDLPAHLPRSLTPRQQAYVDQIDHADAVVVVTPEYNHGYPASLKQAIDLAMREWARKPVGIVSYGARSGGIRAAEQLRQVFPELGAMTIRESISIPIVWDLFDAEGLPRESAGLDGAAAGMLDQLAWWGQALRTARQADLAMSS